MNKLVFYQDSIVAERLFFFYFFFFGNLKIKNLIQKVTEQVLLEIVTFYLIIQRSFISGKGWVI